MNRRAQHLRRFRRHSGNSNRLEHLRPKEEDRDDAGGVVDAGVAAGETGRGRSPMARLDPNNAVFPVFPVFTVSLNDEMYVDWEDRGDSEDWADSAVMFRGFDR